MRAFRWERVAKKLGTAPGANNENKAQRCQSWKSWSSCWWLKEKILLGGWVAGKVLLVGFINSAKDWNCVLRGCCSRRGCFPGRLVLHKVQWQSSSLWSGFIASAVLNVKWELNISQLHLWLLGRTRVTPLVQWCPIGCPVPGWSRPDWMWP